MKPHPSKHDKAASELRKECENKAVKYQDYDLENAHGIILQGTKTENLFQAILLGETVATPLGFFKTLEDAKSALDAADASIAEMKAAASELLFRSEL